MPNLFIGTSGWIYSHWDGIFYPEKLSSKAKLKYYSQYFKTVEINYSFYHLPKSSTYQNWYSQTPKDFVFAIKASRFITHIKRLKGVKEAWEQFLESALNLKEKLGPILFQFPPSFQASAENIKRLKDFFEICDKTAMTECQNFVRGRASYKSYNLKYALEFRHDSWCNKKIYKILRKYNVAWVIADSPRYPRADVVTANFIYIRLHGSKSMFASKYTKEELKILAKKIKNWLKQKLDIYCYFNNDAYGYAVENAKELLNLCK